MCSFVIETSLLRWGPPCCQCKQCSKQLIHRSVIFLFEMKYLLIGNSNAMRASNIFITKDHALHKERRILKCTYATKFKLQVKINCNIACLNLAIDLFLALVFCFFFPNLFYSFLLLSKFCQLSISIYTVYNNL